MSNAPDLTQPTALRALEDALNALQRARIATTQGLADDLCANAIDAVKGAIRYETAALACGKCQEQTP